MANLDLSKYGIKDVKEIIHNPSYDVLFAEEEIHIVIQGLEKQTNTYLAATTLKSSKSPSAKAKLKATSSADLGFDWATIQVCNPDPAC